METFAESYTDEIRGVISCFDRVVITGSLPNIRHSGAMAAYLTAMGLKLFEYTNYSLGVMAELLGAANRRYEAFLCALDQPTVNLGQLHKIARPVRNSGRSYRGFNLFHGIDLNLFLCLVRGEHAITGLRNRDIRRHLGLSGSQVSRLLKRLRLHGLLKKIPRRHKYYLTALGRRLIACCLRMREETVLPALALQA